MQRAYYVVWAVVSVGFITAITVEMFSHLRWNEPVRTMEYLGLIAAFSIGPAVLMYATRWIYRGFMPRK